MKRRRVRQLELPVPCGWGGARPGAGRKRLPFRKSAPHRRRLEHNHRHPLHVSLRAVADLVSLRSERVFPRLSRALADSTRDGFRVLQFSVQSDHVHLIVEADSTLARSRGLQGLAVRGARAINTVAGRAGPVWRGR
jgi:putative transposase